MIAQWQKERFLFVPRVLVFPVKSQVRVSPYGIREGVSHGSGRAPSLELSFAGERRSRSQGACPCGAIAAMTSETWRGLYVGVGTWSAWSMKSSVRRAIWKMKADGAAIEEATVRSSPPW